MPLLKQDIIKKRLVNPSALLEPKPEKEFGTRHNKEYKIKVMSNSVVYNKKTKNSISGLYHFVL